MHFRAKNWTEHPALLQDLVRLAGDEKNRERIKTETADRSRADEPVYERV